MNGTFPSNVLQNKILKTLINFQHLPTDYANLVFVLYYMDETEKPRF